MFTIYQLADLVVHGLPKIIQQISPRNKLIVVYDLLHLFAFDPHIDKADAKRLVKETVRSLRKLSKERIMIVSFSHCNSEYERVLLQVFDKRMEITDDVTKGKTLQMNVYYPSFKRKTLSISTTLRKETLSLVPSR